MSCKCKHQLKDHQWNFIKGKSQPCNECDCIDFNDKIMNELGVFFPKIDGFYRAICLYNGFVNDKCPNNRNSLCATKYIIKPETLYHLWEGKNAIKCLCG